MYKTKKNDIVVVEVTSSSTDIKMRTTTYKWYQLAKAERVSRKGIVERYIRPCDSHPYTVDSRHRVLTITDADKQAAVRRLYATLGVHSDNEYDTPETLRNAILAYLEPAEA